MAEGHDGKKERPSTSSGRTVGGEDTSARKATAHKKAGLPPFDDAQDRLSCGPRNDGVEQQRLVPGKHRKVQIARTGKRKLFDRARRKVFLEWFAATANVKMSAEKAGVNYKTVFKHRMKDADFAQDWNRALGQGYARVEAKVLETKARGGGAIAIDGDLDAPELDEVDPQAVQLLREHRRGLAEGTGAGQSRKQGRRPRVASNAEVRRALTKRLAAFRARIRSAQIPPRNGEGDQPAEPDGGGAEPGSEARRPLRQRSALPPPRSGEDL